MKRAADRAVPEAALDNRIFIACGLASAAALIHAVAAIQHVSEYALYAVFFAISHRRSAPWA